MQISAAGQEQLHAPVRMLGITQLESSFAEKDLAVLMDTQLNKSWYQTFVVKKAKGIMGCFRRHVDSRSRKVILHPCLALLVPHQERSTVLGSSVQKRVGNTGESLAKGHKDLEETEVSLLWGKRERTEPGDEKAQGRSH